MDNQRKTLRYQLELDVEIAVPGGEWARARTRNISLGGLFAVCSLPVTVGIKVPLRVQLPTGHTLECEAYIRWHDATGFGFQFDGLRAKEIYALGKYFESVPVSQAS